jgi:D,D-heptose 1,7-bisphosphate phosphatase
MTQAVILAGGKGTRLASLLKGKPKCLVDIAGVPLLERQISLLKYSGIDDIVLLVNYAADQVASFLSGKNNFGIRIRLIDDGEPRGTAGAVLAAFDSLESRFVVLYGDTLLNVDLRRFLAAHVVAGADATLFLHPNDHPADSDLVEIDDAGWVQAFHPYPHAPGSAYANLVNAALYVVEKQALQNWRDFKTQSDFGRDLFPAMLGAQAHLKGYASFEYVKDVGTPARLAKAAAQIASGLVERACLTHKQKAVFLDRDGTINIHRGFITSADRIELYPGAAEAIKRLNEAEYRAVLITNQPVIARGEVTYNDLRAIHAKLETLLGEKGAFLDAIYFCPHHPDKGYAGEVAELKIACNCRKPQTGLIARAVEELNIDLTQSWLIGDATRDIETARRAGIKSICVKTGECGLDGKFRVDADYSVTGIADAINCLLSLREDKK